MPSLFEYIWYTILPKHIPFQEFNDFVEFYDKLNTN